MRKIIIAVSFIFVLASCNQTKIAYVNIDKVLKDFQGSKNAEKLLKEKSDKIMSELEPLAKEFQIKVQEFQQKASRLSAKAKAEQEQQLMKEQQNLQQRQQMAQRQVQLEGQQIYDDINKKVDSLIGVFAKSNGYSFVLGTSPQTKAVVYGDEISNITDKVIEAINKSYPSVKKDSTEISSSDIKK